MVYKIFRGAALVLLAGVLSASVRADVTIVTIETSLGTFQLEMLEDDAPATVANFLGYVDRGDYDGTFMHRSIPGFVLQAGGYRYDPLTNSAPHITTVAPVVNEFGISNTRSTVAMAKLGGDPNSATSEWFVNLGDNSLNLDNQNGGFTVFARVIGNGMDVVDAIVSLPLEDFGGSFTDTPTQNYEGEITADIFVRIISATSQVLSDFDGDGVPDVDDPDDDNDGVPDTEDSFPFDPDRSAPANEPPVLQLIGAASLTLVAGESFSDPGVIATDLEDGEITGEVILLSDLDTTTPGTYTLEYRITDSGGLTSLVTREVIVEQPNLAPVLALVAGDLSLRQNETFSEPGFSALDPEDGDLTSSVQVTGAVDTTAQGTYVLNYSVSDSDGLVHTVSRTVVVFSVNRIAAGQVIELPVVGTALTAPDGSALVVPATATAASINVTAVTPGASGFITVWPCGVARPLASNLNYVAGDVVPNGVIAPIGSNGKVCFFSLADTDLVVDVAGWFEGDAFVGATPLRLVDTRETSRVTPATPLVLQVADIAANTADGTSTVIPANVGAVALNVTVVSPDASGFVTVYPCDVPRPLASNVNYTAGQIVPNGVIAPVSANGEVCIYSLAPTDVVVDLAGWFPGEAFTAATPQRLVDTRDGTGGQLGKLTPAGQLSVAIQGEILTVAGNSAQVPLSATAAALNVTIVNPEASGFATVWPCSAARPLASNLNFVAGQVVANNVIAPIGDQGSVCFYTNVPSDIIVDIAGYFSGEAGNQFVGSTPKRYIDTRSSLGPAPQ